MVYKTSPGYIFPLKLYCKWWSESQVHSRALNMEEASVTWTPLLEFLLSLFLTTLHWIIHFPEPQNKNHINTQQAYFNSMNHVLKTTGKTSQSAKGIYDQALESHQPGSSEPLSRCPWASFSTLKFYNPGRLWSQINLNKSQLCHLLVFNFKLLTFPNANMYVYLLAHCLG